MTEHDSGDPGHAGVPGYRPGPAEDDDALVPPTELSAIQADDALLDALGGADPRGGDDLDDAELHALLLSWRRDVDGEPMPELVDTPDAVTTVRTAAQVRRYAGRGRRRMLVPVAAAAAVLTIGFTGTALAARDAQPGDTLWGLSTVLYSDHAASVEAAASVRTDLAEAHLAIAQQRYDDARSALGQAEQTLSDVVTEEESRLRARHEELRAQLDEPAPQPPPAESSSDGTSSTGADDTTNGTGTASSSENSETELDETSSVPSTEPPTSTEPTESSSSSDETSSDDESSSGENRDDTSSSGESDDPLPTS
ncbi:anti-sigma-D factor RsdA [Saccharomonospora halophila]|uniref:anti-sigma-D factor RsdA n=1 Tax=Saccharomonospora halophila TaxID=129922 RepID=UPI00036965A8|nr:anti-sigma-D factor RsdA [Saccharomonospora halophila]